MSRCGFRNPLVMLRARGLAGPFFQNVGGGHCMHSAGNFIGARGGPLPWQGTAPYCCLDFSQATLEPQSGNPNGVTVDFTRASTATVVDYQGRVIEVQADEARFQGARRVQNLAGSDFSDASYWITPGVTVQGTDTLVHDGSAVNEAISIAAALRPSGGGKKYRFRVNFTYTGKTKVVRFSWGQTPWTGRLGDVDVLVESGQTYDVATNTNDTTEAGSTDHRAIIFPNPNLDGDPGDAIQVHHVQFEDVTGNVNDAPSEFVANPGQHGAGIDGVQYFTYRNGNTVDANGVVTEAKGPAISDIAYLNEPAATNLILSSVVIPWDTITGTPWGGIYDGYEGVVHAEPAISMFPGGQAVNCTGIDVVSGVARAKSQLFTLDGVSRYTATVWIEILDTDSAQVVLGIYDAAGTAWGASGAWRYDPVTNAFPRTSYTGSIPEEDAGYFEIMPWAGPNGGKLIKFVLLVESDQFTGGPGLYTYPLGTSGIVQNVGRIFHGAQVELGDMVSTSMIITEDAAVTRAGDDLQYQGLSNLTGEMAAAVDFQLEYYAPTTVRLVNSRGAPEWRTQSPTLSNFRIVRTGSDPVSGAAMEMPILEELQNKERTRIAWNVLNPGSVSKLFKSDGSQYADEVEGIPLAHSSTYDWDIGNRFGAQQVLGLLYSVKLFDQGLPDSELVALANKDWTCPEE